MFAVSVNSVSLVGDCAPLGITTYTFWLLVGELGAGAAGADFGFALESNKVTKVNLTRKVMRITVRVFFFASYQIAITQNSTQA